MIGGLPVRFGFAGAGLSGMVAALVV